MYEREIDGRREVAVTDIEALVPENHLVRKIEMVLCQDLAQVKMRNLSSS